MRQVLLGIILSGVIAEVAIGESANPCGSLENAYGPFDYTSSKYRRENLPIVERRHFTPDVESLKRGSTGPIWADLDYTLRAFPNHHRALYAMAMYQLKNPKSVSANRTLRSILCYFDRATRFKRSDGNVQLVYGIYLHRAGKLKQSLQRYMDAEKLIPAKSSAQLYYNMGLLHLDLKNYEDARIYARKAYQMGYHLPGLRNRMKKLGIWKDN